MYLKLKKIRSYNMETLKKAGELINKSHSCYLNKEKGKTPFTVEEARIISKHYGMSIEELFFENECSNYGQNVQSNEREESEVI